MAFLIRPATLDDADALAWVNVQCWREAYVDLLSPAFLAAFSVEEMAGKYRRMLEHGDIVHVAEFDGVIRGYATAGPPRDKPPVRDLELSMIYVLASEYGSGAGQALIEAAIGDAPASLWVADPNPRAQAFYRRNGFEPDGAHDLAERWENLAEIRMVR